MLKSFQGITKDFRGCEFHYTCNKVVNVYGKSIEQTYTCKEFPELKGKTLKELKEKVSNFGG